MGSALKVSARASAGVVVRVLAAPDREQQQHDADGGGFEHFADASEPQVNADGTKRNGNGRADLVNTPQGLSASVFTTTSDRTASRMTMMARIAIMQVAITPARGVHFLLHHLAERFAIAPDGGEEDHKILHRAAEHDADQNPECARQITELGGEHRADQRPGPGDGGEMMAEDDPFVCFYEVPAVVVDFTGGGAAVIQMSNLRAAIHLE